MLMNVFYTTVPVRCVIQIDRRGYGTCYIEEVPDRSSRMSVPMRFRSKDRHYVSHIGPSESKTSHLCTQ